MGRPARIAEAASCSEGACACPDHFSGLKRPVDKNNASALAEPSSRSSPKSLTTSNSWPLACFRPPARCDSISVIALPATSSKADMTNHYHLLIETPEANLVAGMRWFQD